MNLKTSRMVLQAVAAYWAATAAMAQVPLSLDTTFQSTITEKNVNSLALLPNGDVLLSGRVRFPGDMSDRPLAKLDPQGTGIPAFPFGYGGAKIRPWNGQFYVGGGTVRRLLPSGLLDPTFINMNTGPYFEYAAGGDYHVYPDGRILMSGTHTLSDTARGFVGNYDLIWFSNTGYLDTTMIHRRGTGALLHFKELPNGQFIGSGNITEWEGEQVDWIFRFNADGTTDTTFRTGVYVGSGIGFLGLPDGRVYVGGRFNRTQAPTDTLELVRFNTDGSLDSSFVIPQFSDDTLNGPFVGPGVVNVYPWPSGRLLVTGQFRYVNGEPRNGICVFDSTGLLQPEFDACGVDPVTFTGNPWEYADVSAMVIDTANQYIYICGAYMGYNDGTTNDTLQRFVSRLHLGNFGVGVQEEEIGEGQLLLFPNPAHHTAQLTWKLPAHMAKGNAQLTIVDARGAAYRTQALDLSEGSYQLDVSGLAPGLYYVHVVAGTTWVTGCKLVVE